MKATSFTATVTDGHLHAADPRFARQAVAAFEGEQVDVVVRKWKAKRSLDQNAYIHAEPIPRLAEHFGYTIPEMKLVLMGECWGWKHVGGHQLPVKPSTSDMTVDECKYFIDWVIPWAMTEHGVTLMLPNEIVEAAS